MDDDIQEIIDWARLNTEITHDADDLIIGEHNTKRFRIFPTEGWVGVIAADGDWTDANACYEITDCPFGCEFDSCHGHFERN
jgi:hypothetical protein